MNERRSLQLLAEKYEQVHAKVSSVDPKITTRKLISEQSSILNETELYHATTKDKAESIKVNGPELSFAGQNFGGTGKSQGAGFYFYKNKKRALNHATEYRGEVILVFDQNINSDVFDIDYEGEYNLAGKYLMDNVEYVKANQEQLGIKKFNDTDKRRPLVTVDAGPGGYGTIGLQDDDVSGGQANKMAHIFRQIQKINPTMFNAFEQLVLNVSSTLKYNGTEKIFPVRIEDLQGNIIWSREPVRS